MREIKFRAWGTIQNKMWSAKEMGRDELTINPDGMGFVNVNSIDTQRSEYYSHLTPLQFTGLKDKNGEDMYEGDIVQNLECFGCLSGWGDFQDNFPTLRIIVWDRERVGFTLDFIEETIKGRGCSGYMLCPENRERFEVVGNIYENQEFLSEKETER